MILRRIDNDFLIGIGGLTTCVITALVGLWEFTIASKEFARFVPYPIAQFAVWTGQILFKSEQGRIAASFWLYLVLWVVHILVFAVAYWMCVRPGGKRSPGITTALLLIQLGAALSGQQPLLYLFAFELPFIMPGKKAVGWLIAGWLLSVAVDISFMHSWSDGLLSSSLYETCLNLGYLIIYEIMHFTVGLLAAKERADRHELEKAHARLTSANAELLATQMLLSDTVRAAERMRIARDLHDSIGHNLMAQNLHLELALRKCQTAALKPIASARELARSLLHEVRRVVSTERKDEAVNLRQILETYCKGIPSRRIVLSFDDKLDVTTPAIANAIFRSIQEAINGAAHHAGGASLRIALTKEDGGIALHIADDGVDPGMTEEDRSFHVMQERIEMLGGQFDKEKFESSGFKIRIWLPQLKRSFA